MERASAAIAPRPSPGEDEHVVGLADLVPPPVDLDGVERRAGRDERPAVGPAQDVDRRRLGRGGRVRERQDDRPVGPGGQRAEDRFVERAAHPGRPDQDRRADALDRLDEPRELGREAVVRRPPPGSASSRFVSSRSSRRSWTCPCESTRTSAAGRRPRPSRPRASPGGGGGRSRSRPRRRRRARPASPRGSPEPPQPGQDAGHDDRRRPLDVVVERRDAVR